jgi:hypothetical protein
MRLAVRNEQKLAQYFMKTAESISICGESGYSNETESFVCTILIKSNFFMQKKERHSIFS